MYLRTQFERGALSLVLAAFLSVSIAPLLGDKTTSLKTGQRLLLLADSLYEQQRFTGAYALYRKIDRTGQSSVRMLLRMAYVKEGSGQTAEALALLSRSYYKSYDPVIRQKIEDLAEEQSLSGYDFSEAEPLFLFLTRHREAFMWNIIIGFIIFLIGFYLDNKHRKSFTSALFTFFTLLSILSAILITKPWRQVSYGIVIQDQAWLRRAPSAAAPKVGTLPYGTRVRLLAQDSVWTDIKIDQRRYTMKTQTLLTLGTENRPL